jgi:hypothetical protein
MNARTLFILPIAGLLTLLAAAPTQAQSDRLKATIPFAFTAGTTTMPAGVYDVSRPDGSQALILIRSRTGVVFVISPSREADNGKGDTRLVFNRYGDQYFLRAVWFVTDDGFSLPETKVEREWAAGLKDRRAANAEIVSIQAALQ